MSIEIHELREPHGPERPAVLIDSVSGICCGKRFRSERDAASFWGWASAQGVTDSLYRQMSQQEQIHLQDRWSETR